MDGSSGGWSHYIICRNMFSFQFDQVMLVFMRGICVFWFELGIVGLV